jgi:hypothetical protein
MRPITVPTAYHDGLFLAWRASVRGRVVGRGGRARVGCRDGPVTVGDRIRSSSLRSICAPQGAGRDSLRRAACREATTKLGRSGSRRRATRTTRSC